MLHRNRLDPATKFDLTRHQYLTGIYECQSPEIVIMKASQLGLSEYAVSRAIYSAEELKANVLYLMPTIADVSDFSQMRLDPAIKASPHLTEIMIDASQNGRGGVDKVTMKQIHDSFIVFRGAKVDRDGKARQLKSLPVDVLIRDEVDEMDPRAREIARKRLGHSSLKHDVALSTPTFPGVGIHAEWEESSQCEYFIRCGHCGHRQMVSIENVVIEYDDLKRPFAWYGQDEDTAWCACTKCHKQLDTLQAGEWVATYPGRSVAGYHPTKFLSPYADVSLIVKDLQDPSEIKQKETYNQDLGIPYTPPGTTITKTLLNQCKRDYIMGPTDNAGTVVMGVDVGALLNVVIRGNYGDNGSRPLLLATEVKSFNELKNLISQYRVSACVVDASPETREARSFQESQPKDLVWLAYYDLDYKEYSPVKWDHEKRSVHLDRTRTLENMYSMFFQMRNTLPANIDDTSGYDKHLMNLVRTKRTNNIGIEVMSYQKTGADHYAHAENYCSVASLRTLSWSRGPSG